jgi:hypothetical protein
MGYYTDYTISAEPTLPEDFQWPKEFYVEEYGGGSMYTHDKWYSWRDDITEFSKKHPNILFTVHGEGEDSSDLWNCYIQNGKSQYCEARIEYPPYDPKEMK